MPVRRSDREKTAFSSPFGQYQFVRIPFGLAMRPATYSRLVAQALRHLPSSEVLCYLDDTAIHSHDAWSHLRTLRKVLAAFCAAGLQISPGKAQLFRDHTALVEHPLHFTFTRLAVTQSSAQLLPPPPTSTSRFCFRRQPWPLSSVHAATQSSAQVLPLLLTSTQFGRQPRPPSNAFNDFLQFGAFCLPHAIFDKIPGNIASSSA